MPRSEDVAYRWEAMKNPYVPGYTLKRYVGGKRKGDLIDGWSGDLNVQQDINKERWLYGINMHHRAVKPLPPDKKVIQGGHAGSLEEARAAAEKLLELCTVTREVEADAFG